jgi:hypothetical protein
MTTTGTATPIAIFSEVDARPEFDVLPEVGMLLEADTVAPFSPVLATFADFDVTVRLVFVGFKERSVCSCIMWIGGTHLKSEYTLWSAGIHVNGTKSPLLHIDPVVDAVIVRLQPMRLLRYNLIRVSQYSYVMTKSAIRETTIDMSAGHIKYLAEQRGSYGLAHSDCASGGPSRGTIDARRVISTRTIRQNPC